MEFTFTIPGLTKEQGDHLLNIIVAFVEALGLEIGGGLVHQSEDNDGEETT